ncbi:hypothetical protein [Leeuwenhoekiella sp. H156]|uniref:hypothetical protein n=1 Tax=Leeuwenhoekiella sp. H156 TaxID=3450128 RepID=UPI003FA4786D
MGYIESNWDVWLISIVTGAVGSIIVILCIFAFGKPKFRISSQIAYLDTEEFGIDLKGSFLIKVQNLSFFESYDMCATLVRLETYTIHDGENSRSFKVEIVEPMTNYLKGRHLYKNTGKSAFIFRTNEDLRDILRDNKTKLRFTLFARNGFSGLTKIFTQEFNTVSRIKTGHFCFGKCFDIN